MIAVAIIKVKTKTQGNLVVIEILTYFNCLFNDDLSQVMCIASFSFNLYEQVAVSKISKHSVSHSFLQFLLVLR